MVLHRPRATGGPMTAPQPQPATGATSAAVPPAPENASTGQLISQLTEQISRLVRDEARLAQAEVTQKAKKLGVGAGLFGGAGLVAFFGPTDPDAIRADIEATREQLGRTVDELSQRLDVPARAKESAARAKDTAVETYRESPPAVIGAAGAPGGG